MDLVWILFSICFFRMASLVFCFAAKACFFSFQALPEKRAAQPTDQRGSLPSSGIQRPRPTSHLARSSASQALAQQLPRLPTPRINDKSGQILPRDFATKILMFESCPNGWIPPPSPWRLSTAQPSLLQGPHARATLEWLNTQAMAVLFYSVTISKVCRSSPNLTSKSLEIKIDSTAKYAVFSNICHLHLQITTPKPKPTAAFALFLSAGQVPRSLHSAA